MIADKLKTRNADRSKQKVDKNPALRLLPLEMADRSLARIWRPLRAAGCTMEAYLS